jgi:hypothetical protein
MNMKKKEWSSCSQTGKVGMRPLAEPEQIQYTGWWFKEHIIGKCCIMQTQQMRPWCNWCTGAGRIIEEESSRGPGAWWQRCGYTSGESLQRAEIVPELEFLKNLWGLGTEEEEGYRTGLPGYIGWRNSFLGINSGAPYMFKNTGSGSLPRKVGKGISFRNNSAEWSRKGFRYSAEESAHSEVYGRVNSEARNGTESH